MKLRKLSVFVLILVMCMGLAACGKTPEGNTAAESGTGTGAEAAVGSEIAAGAEASQTAAPDAGQNTGADAGSDGGDTDESAGAVISYEPMHYETDDLTWDFDEGTGTLSIHGEGPMRDYMEDVPEWESCKDQVLKITLDQGITSVGAYAFFNYMHVTEVSLPDTVEMIGESAFDYDWELRAITLPASLRYVGTRAFYNTLLWEPADLAFPEGCVFIGDYAFHSALKSGGTISLPASLEYLGEKAFTNSLFSDITVAEGNAAYRSGNGAVYTGDGKDLRMVATCGENRREFTIPEGVERLSGECFNAIRGIEKITIPASVTEIPEGTFFSTFELKEITVDGSSPAFRSEGGLLLSKDSKLLLAWPDGMEGLELVVPEGVERIGAYLFYGRYDSGYTVVIPEGVKEIGSMSLPYDMASLTLPSSLERIDDNVFYDGIVTGEIRYNGTQADWDRISLGEGNTGLNTAAIIMN